MANKYEISSHLIDQVQILLMKEAGLDSSFTSTDDQSFDSWLKEAIFESNPAVDASSRCKNCGGELLRGSQSIICVYCGLAQHQDCIPNPISFNSTIAFQWFLRSLGLDANETVGIPVGGAQSSDRGQGSIKEDEIPLSNFLDLELKWGDHSRGSGLKAEDQLPGKRYLRLIGVDIEELLSQESVDHGSRFSNEQSVVNQNVENDEFKVLGERNRNLFVNAQPFEAAYKWDGGGNDESFADWGAEFQSPSIPDPRHDKFANISSSDDPSRSNLNVSSGRQSFEFNRSDKQISADSSFDWLPADDQHNVKKDFTNNEKKDDDDDDWGDFRMSRTDTIAQVEPISTAGPTTNTIDGLGISDSYNDLSKDIQVKKYDFTVPEDAWNDLTIPSSKRDSSSQIKSDKSGLNVGTGDLAVGKESGVGLLDSALLGHQGVSAESTQSKISDQSDLLGRWGGEIHLNSIGDPIPPKEIKSPAAEVTTKLDYTFDLLNGFRGSGNQQATNTEVAASKISTEGSSTFDTWNDFSGLGMENKEQASSLDVVGVKVNGSQSESLGMWNDKSFDEWSDFTGSTAISSSKPIANDDSSGAWNDISSLMVTPENPKSSNIYEDQAALQDDNLFSSWSDFGSSKLQTGHSFVGPNDSKTNSNQISFQKSHNGIENVRDNNTIDPWGDFGSATSIVEQQLQASGAGTSESNLGSGDDFFSGIVNSSKQSPSQPVSKLNMSDGKVMDENDDSIAWGDFTASNNAESNLGRTVNAPTADVKEAVKHGDLLATWNGNISSSSVQTSKDTSGGIGENSGSNLFSPSLISQYVGTISSIATDLPASMVSNQNGSAPVAFAQYGVSDLVRAEGKDDGSIEGKSVISKEGLDYKACIAETLISEMHDLSFMLESSLSIPESDI